MNDKFIFAAQISDFTNRNLTRVTGFPAVLFKELFFLRLSCPQTLSTMLRGPDGINVAVLKFREVRTQGGQICGHP